MKKYFISLMCILLLIVGSNTDNQKNKGEKKHQITVAQFRHPFKLIKISESWSFCQVNLKNTN